MAHDRRRSRVSAAILTATLTMVVASCSGGDDSLSEEDFKAGVCRESAGSILAVQDAVRQLQDDEKEPEEAADTLRQSQTTLRAARDEAEEALTVKISALTNAIGEFRIGVDTGTIGPEQIEKVDTALEGVLTSCTGS